MLTRAAKCGRARSAAARSREHDFRSRRAFTLFELVLVMVIITTVLAIISPSLRRFAHGASMRNVSTDFVAMCQLARTQAISTARVHRLVIDTNTAQCKILVEDADQFVPPEKNFGKVEIPQDYKISLTKADGTNTPYIDFFPTGRTEAARIVITADDGEQAVIECPTPSETFRVVQAEAPR
jgi:prepilin-type N-terminal cleavage/methylation domain-containing protein